MTAHPGNEGTRRLATPEEVAEWLQVSVDKLRKMRSSSRGPKFIKDGRMIRYAWGDVHAWALSRRAAGGE